MSTPVQTLLSLEGKTALVTGGSRGLGLQIAESLGEAGAKILLTSRKAADLEEAAAHLQARGIDTRWVAADASQPDEIQRVASEAMQRLGKVDILVNNAGVYQFAPLEQIDAAHFHWHFDLNVLGLLLATKEAVALFPESGGNVINISSVVSTGAFPGAAVYSATKGAVDAITRALAAELGPRGIRVNAINPGMVETEGTHSTGIAGSDLQKQVEAVTPLGRIGQPQDIATAAVFLASADSSWITGQTFQIAGGYRA